NDIPNLTGFAVNKLRPEFNRNRQPVIAQCVNPAAQPVTCFENGYTDMGSRKPLRRGQTRGASADDQHRWHGDRLQGNLKSDDCRHLKSEIRDLKLDGSSARSNYKFRNFGSEIILGFWSDFTIAQFLECKLWTCPGRPQSDYPPIL